MPATKNRASSSAARHWSSQTDAEKRARTAKAVEAATERRRKAHRVLDALEQAGIEVSVGTDEVSS